MDFYNELYRRGFIYQCTDSLELQKKLKSKNLVGYVGFDPTAKSLHVGSLLPLFALMHFKRNGHRPIVLVGDGTAMIGDPSGKTKRRSLLDIENIKENSILIRKQLQSIFGLEKNDYLFLNNLEWLKSLNYMNFLRDVGSNFSVNRMIAAESAKQRLSSKQGLSLIEFNYSVLQAYDFYYQVKHYDCILQIGGRDQWGNILAGVELVRKVLGKKIFGLTLPLVLNSSGEKMGKTHSGAIWLDEKLTSVYDFYQYWINVSDTDVERFLKFFTFLSLEEIAEISSLKGSAIKKAKSILAFEVTKVVHGKDKAKKAQKASSIVFNQVKDAFTAEIPSISLIKKDFIEGMPLWKLFVKAGLCKTNSEARRLIKQGGAYIDNVRFIDFEVVVDLSFFSDRKALLLRSGKKKYRRILLK